VLPRRELNTVDGPLLTAVLLLCAVGVLFIASATEQNPALQGLAARQALWVGIGLAGLLTAWAIDYRTLAQLSWVAYAALVLVLIWLLSFGKVIAGTRGWLDLGFMNLQPAELAKVVVVLAIAAVASTTGGAKLGAGKLAALAAVGGLPIALILRQPDLGTALTLVPALLVTVFVAGIQVRVLVALALVLALAMPLAWMTVLKDYQKERVLTFFDPGRDPQGAGYQVRQSKIAVGSGGLFGKGVLRGTQSQLQFLPAQHTDFIFGVVAEELGFAGAALVIGLYLFVTLRCFFIAGAAQDKLGRYICLAFGSVFGCQALINLGMVLGLVPTVGIPLPLLSYGGSSMVATMTGFGLVLNVGMRRFVN
jgi:rod shape determining protein RodA